MPRLIPSKTTVAFFVFGFLASDYVWYRVENPYVKPSVWPRVLGPAKVDETET